MTLREEISKILTYTPAMKKAYARIARLMGDDCFVCGRPFRIDKQRQMYVDAILALIKKHERGLLEEIYKYAKDLTSVTDNKKHNTAVLRLLNYLAKLKEVEE